jgi:glucose/arabinose dehydrogenase
VRSQGRGARALRRLAAIFIAAAALTALPGVFEEDAITVPVATPAPPRALELVDLKLTLAARVPRPTAMAVRNNDEAIYVASKKGTVWQLIRGQRNVVLDISDEISFGFEQGLLGLAFTPDGNTMVIDFTDKGDASIVRTYRFDGRQADPRTAKDLWRVPKPAEEHNAGQLAFGPDGYLYVSLGDGGLSGDPDNNAQSLDTMLGKIHRVQILSDGSYEVPPDNPFVGREKVREEIWAYGFRNPWRFSFDRQTGDLWIADVGRDTKEEISFEPAGSGGGRNYGWNLTEGSVPYEGRTPPKNWTPPVHDYDHDGTTCSVTGGYVYRGTRIKGLAGAYLFSDYCKGGIEAIRIVKDDDGSYEVTEHRAYDEIELGRIASFGQDADGELYVLALDEGAIYRVDPLRV